MERYHTDPAHNTFKKLQQGQLPIGTWKYCSNWKDVWNVDFEPKDVEFKNTNQFTTKNKMIKKRKAKENKKALLYYHCEKLHPLGVCANIEGDNPNKIYKPQKKSSRLTETEIGQILESVIDSKK